MAQPDFRGARGSNAGDNFHELWALRQSLALLDQQSGLTGVTVEGLVEEDESGIPPDTWDGVDCTLYFGGNRPMDAERIVIAQLKYSASNREQTWTIARLTHATNKKQDNSVIRKLAKAFIGLQNKRPNLVADGKVTVQLVSNQPIEPTVVTALSDPASPERATLRNSSGLGSSDFEAFAKAIDLSDCGRESRFGIEERILTTISGWTNDDASAAVNTLLRGVQRAMLPEAKGEFITRQSVVAWMGFADHGALFPCPPAIKRIDPIISRRVSRTVVERMVEGGRRICVHGEGGCGKTTALQEIEELMPDGSVAIVFDCYGNGRYLNSDAYRHRVTDAFLQLSNELANRFRIPLLLSRSPNLDYPRVFKNRLMSAAEIVASRASAALLVVIVDAADNSLIAASTRSPSEISFVQDFLNIGDLPDNVRILVTARTGRLSSLNLPTNFEQVEIKGFELAETTLSIRQFWNDAPDNWIEDFHHLSGGNPRVQQYALDYAKAETARAIDYLRPNGRNLDQIFRQQLEFARQKVGSDQEIKAFCSGLATLPRPIPLSDLAAVIELNPAHVRDLCSDLAPGVRLVDNLVGFADEDFEHFVRVEGEAELPRIQTRMAEYFLSRNKSDAYAATHIAAALLAAQRRQEILDLIKADSEPKAIADPVLRLQVQRNRLRIAMKVCMDAGNNADAILTLLIGAEALKTDTAIRHTLIQNPDLAANFAHENSAKLILRDAAEIQSHGPLLFHLMAADARKADRISAREKYRYLQAWFQRRRENFDEQKRKHPHSHPHRWSIDDRDIAAEIETALRITAPQQAVDQLRRWSPRSLGLRVALILSRQLIKSGDLSLVWRCINEAGIQPPWDLFLFTPLALAGEDIEISRVERSLRRLLRHRLFRVQQQADSWRDDEGISDYLETILTACEIVVARGGNHASVIPVLERFTTPELRRRDNLHTSRPSTIDLTLRAHALVEQLAGRETSLETYLVSPPEPSADTSTKEAERLKRSDEEKKEELHRFIGPIIQFYNVRARALVGSLSSDMVGPELQSAIKVYKSEEWRIRRQYDLPAMRGRIASAISRLMSLPGLSRSSIFENALNCLGSDSMGALEARLLDDLALDRSLHGIILRTAVGRAVAIRELRTSAQDKVDALIRLSRLLLPISFTDSNALFNQALEVASELDEEAIHQICLLTPLAARGISTMLPNERREVGRDVAIIVNDAAVRLEGHDHFPWTQAAEALATLDLPLALAASARWEDGDIVDRSTFLSPVLANGVRRHELSPQHAAALLPLLDNGDVDLIDCMIKEAGTIKGNLNLGAFADEVAKEELLRFGNGTRKKVSDALNSLPIRLSERGFWLARLMDSADFHSIDRTDQALQEHSSEKNLRENRREKEELDPLDVVDWKAYRFVSAKEVSDVIRIVTAAARAADSYVNKSSIYDRVRANVALTDRRGHLDALADCASDNVSDYELADAISKGVLEWRESPSIDAWCKERLRSVIVNQLPGFSAFLPFDRRPLPDLLKKSGLPDHELASTLIEGLERHVEALHASTIYAMLGLASQYCLPGEAAQVLQRYVNRLLQRIVPSDREEWQITDIPMTVPESMCRFLYALMSDVDVGTRWRAAHALRSLVRLGVYGVIDGISSLYDRTSEVTYRMSSAPFYWLASRLWLMIAFDRISDETPVSLKDHGQRYLQIACDDDFPHLLIRSFAKFAAVKLVAAGVMDIKPKQQRALKNANTSLMPQKKGQRPYYNVGFDRYSYKERDERRFHFDMMDTLPYWYTFAMRCFANIDEEKFLDTAENWIVDRWGVRNNPREWEREPRKQRLSRRSLSTSHSHGSLPAFERFTTYLEWHAMWCATGELMQRYPLVKPDKDHYDTFETWLSNHGLTAPPEWLSDLR